ncbi:MAG: 5-carboxymethyl-2-hydroxymuconate isomerase, partial [Pseudomonas sp.]
MPHLHMEYTANLPELNADVALIRLNNTLVASGQ